MLTATTVWNTGETVDNYYNTKKSQNILPGEVRKLLFKIHSFSVVIAKFRNHSLRSIILCIVIGTCSQY